MNCANHADTTAVAYCRTCGKPLCEKCTRDVRGVIYCENCLADRLHGVQPPIPPPVVGFAPTSHTTAQAVPPGTGPNPGLAGVLAGMFPFGVGAVYTGQYVKGLVHLGIFVLLIVMVSGDVPWYLHMFFGISIAFFIVYQIADAVRTARALQTGQPAPDPFGLGKAFSPGEKIDTSKVPLGAIILIGLGVLFLLHNVLDFDIGHIWPLILIGLGVWLGGTKMGLLGGRERVHVHPRSLLGPAILITLGGLFLLDEMNGPGFGRTWPVLLLVIGVFRLLGGDWGSGGNASPPPNGPWDQTTQSEVPPAPPTEVKNV